MRFFEEDRPSESPLIERVWHSQSDRDFDFISRAGNHSEIVIASREGGTTLTVRGPETLASPARVLADSECIGIVFKLGTFIPSFLPRNLLDRRDVDLPVLSKTTFRLDDSTWEIPNFENADSFVQRLIRRGLLVHDADAAGLLHDLPGVLSARALQYRVGRATGLSYRTIRQIERAQRATTLLSTGKSVLDTVFEAGYFDQPHLTRSLKRFVGLTPLQIARATWSGSLLIPRPDAADSAPR